MTNRMQYYKTKFSNVLVTITCTTNIIKDSEDSSSCSNPGVKGKHLCDITIGIWGTPNVTMRPKIAESYEFKLT